MVSCIFRPGTSDFQGVKIEGGVGGVENRSTFSRCSAGRTRFLRAFFNVVLTFATAERDDHNTYEAAVTSKRLLGRF